MELPQLDPERSDPDDRQLVAALVAGDGRGLAVAYDRHAAAIRSFCFALLQDRHAAEDAVQDVFVVLAGRIGQLRKPDRLRAWLYTVARRLCYRQLLGRGHQSSRRPHAQLAVHDEEPPWPRPAVRLTQDGLTQPIHASGLGKAVMLGTSEDERRELLGEGPFPRYTAHTITTHEALTRDLKAAVDRGTCI